MLEVHSLTKLYGERTVVDDVGFTIREGKVTGFLGPNGAGKTTTLGMILGLIAPDSGEALFDGRPYRDIEKPLRHVGALLDASAMRRGHTAAAHLCALAASNGIARSRVDEVLDMVGLTDVARQRIGTLSLGLRQRLGIAAALLGDPGVLIFDEPINGLDPEGITWVRRLMRSQAAAGRAVLVSSHLMSEMEQSADHLLIVGRGRLVADTGLREFVATAASPKVLVRTPSVGQLSALLAERGVRVVEARDPDSVVADGLDSAGIAALAASHGVPVHQLVDQHDSLEEAYLRLTADEVEYEGEVAADVA